MSHGWPRQRRMAASGIAAFVLGLLAAETARAEIVLRDFFARPAGAVTNGAPLLDAQGDGWQAAGAAAPWLDGNGPLAECGSERRGGKRPASSRSGRMAA